MPTIADTQNWIITEAGFIEDHGTEEEKANATVLMENILNGCAEVMQAANANEDYTDLRRELEGDIYKLNDIIKQICDRNGWESRLAPS